MQFKQFKMSVLLVFASLVLAATAVPDNNQDVEDSFFREVNAVKKPFLETLSSIASEKCENLKKSLGLDYSHLEECHQEPDLSQLSFVYVTKDGNVTLDFDTASKLLPKTPDFKTKHLVIYMHGWLEDPNKKFVVAITQAFLSRGSYNILALNASSLIGSFYLPASTNVHYIGNKVGSFLVDLVKEGLQSSLIHLVGHSLGAQIAAFTGKQFLAETGRCVGHITGLDPAGPCFIKPNNSALMLGPGDADFVDVIHTNGGVGGFRTPVGQVDYYPNGGEEQPGCMKSVSLCDHRRSCEFYTETVYNDCAFPAVRCDSWEEFKKGNCDETSYMGIASKPGTTGKFYLQTGDTSPYSLGQKGTQYVDNGCEASSK